ncbi:MAG: hypothetical protein ISN28_11065 [Ectothiorhodospiraceae bacterium AqS1]|nr:hypothetical protein [Ectothiorhodospiraceae bacterium AqS1]
MILRLILFDELSQFCGDFVDPAENFSGLVLSLRIRYAGSAIGLSSDF